MAACEDTAAPKFTNDHEQADVPDHHVPTGDLNGFFTERVELPPCRLVERIVSWRGVSMLKLMSISGTFVSFQADFTILCVADAV